MASGWKSRGRSDHEQSIAVPVNMHVDTSTVSQCYALHAYFDDGLLPVSSTAECIVEDQFLRIDGMSSVTSLYDADAEGTLMDAVKATIEEMRTFFLPQAVRAQLWLVQSDAAPLEARHA